MVASAGNNVPLAALGPAAFLGTMRTLNLEATLPPIVLIKSAIQPCIVDMATLFFLVGIVGALLLCLC